MANVGQKIYKESQDIRFNNLFYNLDVYLNEIFFEQEVDINRSIAENEEYISNISNYIYVNIFSVLTRYSTVKFIEHCISKYLDHLDDIINDHVYKSEILFDRLTKLKLNQCEDNVNKTIDAFKEIEDIKLSITNISFKIKFCRKLSNSLIDK